MYAERTSWSLSNRAFLQRLLPLEEGYGNKQLTDIDLTPYSQRALRVMLSLTNVSEANRPKLLKI